MADDLHEGEEQGRAGFLHPVSTAGAHPAFKSSDIFAGAREVIIEHDGEHYRLRLTGKGKLILTK